MFICVMKENSSFNKSKSLQNSSNNKLRPRIINFISCLSPFFFILFFPNILSLLGCLSVSFYVSVLNTKKICCLINSVTITSHLIEARATCCCSDESSCWHWRAVAGTCWLPLSPAWCLYKGSIKTMIQGTRETTDWVARRCWWGATWTGTPSLALPGLLNSKEAWSLSAGFINSSALWVTCFVALDFGLKIIYILSTWKFLNLWTSRIMLLQFPSKPKLMYMSLILDDNLALAFHIGYGIPSSFYLFPSENI